MARVVDSPARRAPTRVLACALLFACGPARPPAAEARAAAQVIELEPPEDRQRSPHTGWTRAHHEAVFARLLLGFVDHRSPDGARTRYPGGEGLPAAMEGAVRMLPALEAWLACPCNPDRVIVDGRELDVAALARDIVVNGTNPHSADYWHPIRGGWDQRTVEAAMVASILVHARARVWDRLSVFEQARVMAWLKPSEAPLAANWLSFQLARDNARRVLGYPVEHQAITRLLELIEADYRGDGFYRDGGQQRFDWYNAFVIHPQLSAWRRSLDDDEADNLSQPPSPAVAVPSREDLSQPPSPAVAVPSREAASRERAQRLAERTRSFLGHLPYLMDEHGAVAPIGRSLAYRSAVLAALLASIVAGDGFVEPGLARRMSSGSLRHHLDAGMFDARSVLTRGYHGAQPEVLESYLRPGSQYFMSTSLAALALPPAHPFWTAPEQPLPADTGDFVHAIPAVGWMVEHDRAGLGLVLHNALSASGKPEHHARYRKLAYAPATWFAVETTGRHPYDASFISADAGRFDRARGIATAAEVAPGFAWSRYIMEPEQSAAPASPLLSRHHALSTAVLTPRVDEARAEPRVHLGCVFPSAIAPARAYQGSLATTTTSRGRGGLTTGEVPQPWWYLDGTAERLGSASVLAVGLHGWTRAGPQLDWTGPAKHVLGGPAAWIGLGVDGPSDEPRCFASLEQGARAPFEPEAVLAELPQVEFTHTRASVVWPAGARAWVELASTPAERVLELGPLRLSGPLRMAMISETDDGEGLRTLVAVGLRSVTDERGPLIKSLEPRALLACELGPTRWRCQLDGPVALAIDRVPSTSGRWREDLWLGEGLGEGLGQALDQQLVTLTDDGSGWARLELPGVAQTTMIVELVTR